MAEKTSWPQPAPSWPQSAPGFRFTDGTQNYVWEELTKCPILGTNHLYHDACFLRSDGWSLGLKTVDYLVSNLLLETISCIERWLAAGLPKLAENLDTVNGEVVKSMLLDLNMRASSGYLCLETQEPSRWREIDRVLAHVLNNRKSELGGSE